MSFITPVPGCPKDDGITCLIARVKSQEEANKREKE